MAPAVAEAVVALDLELVVPAVLLPVVALVVLLLQFPARLLREAQRLQPEVAAVVLVQGLVASESLRRR